MTDTHRTSSPTTALVTGANKGIGYEIADQLGALGMRVVVAARDPDRRDEAVARLRSSGRDAHPLTLDVTDGASVTAAAKAIDEQFGRLDVLVNNAGIAGSISGQAPTSADLDTVRAVFETNVLGVITVTNAMLSLLRRSPAPRIVNMSSGVGSLAAMSDRSSYLAGLPGSAAYVPSKTALNSLTVQYAKELRGSGILVNAADPGACATDLNKDLDFVPPRTAAQGAAIAVKLATLGNDGPTGGFFDDDGAVAW